MNTPAQLPKPTEPTEPTEPTPLGLEHAGGRAKVIELPHEAGFAWEATGADSTTDQGEEPYGSQAEAAAHARAFLAQHEDTSREAVHAGCFMPHLDAYGEHIDCDGRPL